MAFCTYCGNQLSEGVAACPKCGHPTAAPVHRPSALVTESNAITALVCGIAGFFVCPVVLHIVAIITGNNAKRNIAANPGLQGEGMARAGVILGWVGLAIFALVIVGAIALVIASPHIGNVNGSF